MILNKLFRKFRRKLVRNKIFIQRTLSYIAIVNSAMIMFLVLSKLQDYGIEIHITKWFLPIYLATFILLIGFGWLEDRLGFFREEMGQQSERNPHIQEWRDNFAKIEKKLEYLETKIENK
jgi:hypothetical protein